MDYTNNTTTATDRKTSSALVGSIDSQAKDQPPSYQEPSKILSTQPNFKPKNAQQVTSLQ